MHEWGMRDGEKLGEGRQKKREGNLTEETGLILKKGENRAGRMREESLQIL